MPGQWVLALTGLAAEPEVVRRLGESRDVIRRVTDLVELLALAQPGLSDGLLVSARFPQMSRDVAFRVARGGIPVWGLVDPGDDVGERMLRDWGIASIPVGRATDLPALLEAAPDRGQPPPPACPIIAVTGPHGAPGRTTVALNLAVEWPGRTLLLDADPQAPSIGFGLGLPAGTPGVRGACREAGLGRLTPASLEAAAHHLGDTAALPADPTVPMDASAAESDGVVTVASATGRVTVADCGPSAGTGGLGAAAMARADVVVTVASPTALGIRRWLDDLAGLRAASGAGLVVVWNEVRSARQHGRLGSRPMQRLAALTESAAPGALVAGLPWDPRAASSGGSSGPLSVAAPRSALRRGLTTLAHRLAAEVRESPGQAPTEAAHGASHA